MLMLYKSLQARRVSGSELLSLRGNMVPGKSIGSWRNHFKNFRNFWKSYRILIKIVKGHDMRKLGILKLPQRVMENGIYVDKQVMDFCDNVFKKLWNFVATFLCQPLSNS